MKTRCWFTALTFIISFVSARAEISLSVEERVASRSEGTWAKGDSLINASNAFDGGLHLEAFDRALNDPGLAVAAYRFRVPPSAKHLRLTIAYETTLDKEANQGVTGLVWVSGEPSPLQGIPTQAQAAKGSAYLLATESNRAQFDFPPPLSVANGFLEVHVIASAGFIFEVGWLRLEAFDEGGRFVVGTAPTPVTVPIDPCQYSAYQFYASPWYSCWAPSCYSVIIINQQPSTAAPTASGSNTPTTTTVPRKLTIRDPIIRPKIFGEGNGVNVTIPPPTTSPATAPAPSNQPASPTRPNVRRFVVTPPALSPPAVTAPNVKPPGVTPPDVKPPNVTPPAVSPPAVTPPNVKPPDVKPPEVKPPAVTPPDVKPPTR